MTEAQRILHEVYGHDGFRPGQEDLVNALISGRDCLGIMPTGAGKSVCYQIPALVRPGAALVISPLISLMKDQVAALIASGVPAAYINSTLTPRQTEIALSRAAAGAYRVIYVAPERLDSPGFCAFARAADISLIAVDEAHCVSQWGQDFRPHYLRIADFIDTLPKRPPVGAFTATATARVREDIVRLLRLQTPQIAVTGFDRPNLFFEVLRPQSKDEALTEILRRQAGRSGIIYCATRRNVERVAEDLQSLGFAVARYHAGLPDAERHSAQEAFQYDRVQLMVATNAFGMGIDKSNVSFVIHYNMPKSMEAYYQEAGRAGRDGEPAECVLLYSPADTITARYLITHSEPNPDLSEAEQSLVRQNDLIRLQQMDSYCTSSGCLREWILRYFGQRMEGSCSGCSGCSGGRYAYAAGSGGKRRAAGTERWVFPESPLEEAEESASGKAAFSGLDALLPDRPELLPMKKGWKPGDAAPEETLFDLLKGVRMRLSGLHRTPPYIICEDAALRDMAEKKPLTGEELLQVRGMGATRVQKYGEPFLQAVGEWLKKHPGDRPAKPEKKPRAAKKKKTEEPSAWTPEEDAILKRALKLRLNQVTMASLFGRTQDALKARAGELGLTFPSAGAYEPWLDEEDGQLRREVAEGMPVGKIAGLHHRTRGAIKSRIRKLGLDGEPDEEEYPF